MNNTTNIYDVDGTIVREAGNNEPWTIEQVQEKIDYYKNKLEEVDKTDTRARYYEIYIHNLTKHLAKLMMEQPIIAPQQPTTEEQVEQVMNELQNELENEENNDNDIPNTTENEPSEEPAEQPVAGEMEQPVEEPEEPSEEPEIIPEEDENAPMTQEDMLVDREDETNMDEYVEPVE